ncbi:MAG TPA: amidohydrolase [archaeon]|nr:amidohydrolase [archaeon]
MSGKTNSTGLKWRLLSIFLFSLLCLLNSCSTDRAAKPRADSIYFNGKIITVDSAFTIAQAVAVKGDRFLALGTDKEILALSGPQTRKIDLEGRTVIPGLIEAHGHPESASLSELEEPLPNPRSLGELLDWIRQQAELKSEGEWVIHPKLFYTRLLELHPPTLEELDSVAPKNPVFLDGSFGGVINSAAMRASGITEQTQNPGLLRDKATGKLNGSLRFTAFDLLKLPRQKEYSIAERAQALKKMFDLYHQVGFTSANSGLASPAEIELYRYMRENRMLNMRIYLNIHADFPFKDMSDEEIKKTVEALGPATGHGDEWIRTGPLKTFIDGGILTGTAFLREPWGSKAREIFGVVDPEYRGIARCTADQFARLVQAGAEAGWKMTAHSTGGGGVDLMLDAYEKVNEKSDIRPLRFSIIHGNFFTPEAISRMRKLDIIADMQPAWFYKDADAMLYILGEKRIRTFHPYKSLIKAGVIVSAGSDHMVILDDKNSINPYSPWLAMWTMVTRTTERGTVIIPEEAVSREEALRCYTVNNAYASFEENIKGSIEPGKLADMVVLETDFLTCPDDEIKDIEVKTTLVGGEVVFEK